MGELLKKYLKSRGFELKDGKLQYKVRLRSDFFAAMVYAIASSILICIQEADLIVLGLHILCEYRALINNTITASEVTKAKEGAGIHKKCSSHFSNKAVILSALLFMAVLSWCLLWIDFSSLFVKTLAIIAIITVFLNDTDNIVILAYNAKL